MISIRWVLSPFGSDCFEWSVGVIFCEFWAIESLFIMQFLIVFCNCDPNKLLVSKQNIMFLFVVSYTWLLNLFIKVPDRKRVCVIFLRENECWLGDAILVLSERIDKHMWECSLQNISGSSYTAINGGQNPELWYGFALWSIHWTIK